MEKEMIDPNQASTARFTRRRFLGRAACGAAGACLAPSIVPASVFAADAPSNRINVAMIGMGNQSTVDLPVFMEQDDVQMVAVCDVNTASHGYANPKQYLGRKPGQDKVNAYYAKKTGVGSYKGCDAYNDFRDVLRRDDVDAVAIVVPDHWHALITIAAAAAGKDIYCEKPLSLCIWQGQKMVEAVRKHKRVLQTGSMWRSDPLTRRAIELVRNGRIGKVKRILTDVAANNAVSPGPGWQPMPVPEGFDYDFWLGPAPKAPYHKDRCFYRFRFILDYSGGQTTNFGCHSNGLVQWALGEDAGGPVEFENRGSEWPPAGDLFTTATKVDFLARYAERRRTALPHDEARLRCPLRGDRGLDRCGLCRFQGVARVVAGRETRPERPIAICLHSSVAATQRKEFAELPARAELHRLHQVAQGPDRAGRGRPSHGQPVPPGQYRHEAGSKNSLGSAAGAGHRRRRSGRHAHSPDARPHGRFDGIVGCV